MSYRNSCVTRTMVNGLNGLHLYSGHNGHTVPSEDGVSPCHPSDAWSSEQVPSLLCHLVWPGSQCPCGLHHLSVILCSVALPVRLLDTRSLHASQGSRTAFTSTTDACYSSGLRCSVQLKLQSAGSGSWCFCPEQENIKRTASVPAVLTEGGKF